MLESTTFLISTAIAAGAAMGYGISRLVSSQSPPSETGAPEEGSQKVTEQLEREHSIVKDELRRISNITNLSRTCVWIRNAESKLIYSNLAYSEIADEEENSGEGEFSSLELYPGERRDAQNVSKTSKENIFTRHLILDDGERRLYEIRLTPVPGEDNIAGYARDVNRLDELEQEVGRHESAQRGLLESSTNAMAVFGSDMRLQYYNMSYVNLWRLDERMLDTHPTFAEVIEVLRDDRRLPEQANFKAFKESRLKLFTSLIETDEQFYYLPSGKTLRVLAIPHALGGILFVYEDVTDRLALERSYNTLIAVQKETLDNLHEGVAVFNESGRLTLSNPSFLSIWQLDDEQVTSEPLINDLLETTKPLHAFVDWDNYKGDFVGRMQDRTIQAGRLERTDRKVLDWSSVPLPDGATLLTFIDVTDSTVVERSLREKNEALEAADKLKTEFLANVSYELRSPLASIMGFSDLLLREYVGKLEASQKEYVQGIHDSSSQLNELIANILDLASIDAGYMELHKKSIIVADMFEDTLNLFSSRAQEKNQKVNIVIEDGLKTLRGDETRMKQVMFQLLSNAVKFTPEGGNITLAASHASNKMLVISIEDDGVGIASDRLEHVFETFFRSGSIYGDTAGSGLGLSMVKRLVELHSGRVEIRSAPDKGTKISCFLPDSRA